MEVNNMKENYVKPQIEVCQLENESQLLALSSIPAIKEDADHDLEILSRESCGKFSIWSTDEEE